MRAHCDLCVLVSAFVGARRALVCIYYAFIWEMGNGGMGNGLLNGLIRGMGDGGNGSISWSVSNLVIK